MTRQWETDKRRGKSSVQKIKYHRCDFPPTPSFFSEETGTEGGKIASHRKPHKHRHISPSRHTNKHCPPPNHWASSIIDRSPLTIEHDSIMEGQQRSWENDSRTATLPTAGAFARGLAGLIYLYDVVLKWTKLQRIFFTHRTTIADAKVG